MAATPAATEDSLRAVGFSPSPSVVSREVGGETVLVDLDSELYFSLNTTGALVWEGFAAGSDIDDIVGATSARFDMAADQVRDDVVRLVDELVAAGLLISG